ncbi:hypothetical protein LY76DRAFT_137566 [Colletotrichum caudatum]|nr:hypothetical protein LY76DRAFT_137566 [Colletotrichum caudatum]
MDQNTPPGPQVITDQPVSRNEMTRDPGVQRSRGPPAHSDGTKQCCSRRSTYADPRPGEGCIYDAQEPQQTTTEDGGRHNFGRHIGICLFSFGTLLLLLVFGWGIPGRPYR